MLTRLLFSAVCLVLSAMAADTALSQQTSIDEGLRLAPSTDLGSRGNTDYISTGAAPISIRSSQLPANQSIRIDAGQRVEIPASSNTGAENSQNGGVRNGVIPSQRFSNRGNNEVNNRSRSEFQQLIFKTRGRDLEHFGRNLFGAAPSSYVLTDRVVPSPEYSIAAGDEIRIRAWGQVDIDFTGAVERSGSLYIPVIGPIQVLGVSFRDLKALVRARIAKNYKGFELEVSMGQVHMMQIFVTGQASKPGAYTIGGFSTLINAVFAVGGPNDNGGMRAIEVHRRGKIVAKLDLYTFLLSGDKSQDVRLESGDVLHFPPVSGQAAIAGSVKTPGIFEVLPTTNLQDLINLAGGASTTASGGRVIVERIEDRASRQVAEFALEGAQALRLVKDGDVVQINPISPRFENIVTIRGYVPETQRLSFKPGMRVTDVLPTQMALLANSYWQRKNEKGRGYHWLIDLPQRGTGRGAGFSDFPSMDNNNQQNARQSTSGRMQRHDSLRRSQLEPQMPLTGLRNYDDDSNFDWQLWSRPNREDAGQNELLDDLSRSTTEINWEYALIERFDVKTLRTLLVPFHLGKAIVERDPSENKELMPGDIITVFSNRDIRVPVEKQLQYVRLEGEVARPGVYQINYGEKLASLVQRAGGLTSNAYLFGSEFEREDTREFQQRELDAVVERLAQSLERSAATRLRESLDGGAPGTADASAGLLDAQRRLVRKLSQVRASGRIVLDVSPDQASEEYLDIPLEDGDRFYVPARPSTVFVVGAVNRASAMLHRSNRSLDDYIEQAGGLTKEASPKEIFIIRPNGSVKSVQAGSRWFTSKVNHAMLPGDTIVVPEDTDIVTWRRVLRDWSQIVYQGALGVGSIRLLSDVFKK